MISESTAPGIAEVMASNPVQAWIFFRPYFHYCLSSVYYFEDRFQIHDDTRVEQCLLYVLTWAGSLIGIQDTTTRTSTLETADSVNTLMLTNALKLLTFIHVYREIVY